MCVMQTLLNENAAENCQSQLLFGMDACLVKFKSLL